MQYFPVFLALDQQRVVVSGAGETAASKLRLLLKTSADIHVYGASPCEAVVGWNKEEKLTLHQREITQTDLAHDSPAALGSAAVARLIYIANANESVDNRVVALAKRHGILFCVVDNLALSQFITPAIVDRDPVVVAIGTEGTAPVLARQIKSTIEASLPATTSTLAKVAEASRQSVSRLASAADRRQCWQAFFAGAGAGGLASDGVAGAKSALDKLLLQFTNKTPPVGHVSIVGAGPGDPQLLTLKARQVIEDADVIIYDRLVGTGVLELARREAVFINVGKTPGKAGCTQSEINAALIAHAEQGSKVARLKSGDPSLYGRLDEEITVLEEVGVSFDIVPGVTSALAAAAAAKVSLTKRHRNSCVRFITGQDIDGFAEHDWQSLAQPGSTAVVYMGLAASRFVQGRLLLHGAPASTPVSIVENASRPEQRIVRTTLSSLSEVIKAEQLTGPVIVMLGLATRVVTPSVCEATRPVTSVRPAAAAAI